MVFIRYIVVGAAIFIVSVYSPLSLLSEVQFAYTTVFFLFAFTVAFMIDRTIERQRILRQNLNIELSRLRRVHHLAENIGTAEWQALLDDRLTQYQLQLSQEMGKYEETTASFRDVSHQIYALKPRNVREEILMDDLLETLRELSLGRQYISSGLRKALSGYQWSILVGQTMFLVLGLIANQIPDIGPRIIIAAALGSIFLSIEMLVYTNTFPRAGLLWFQKQYQKNIPIRQEPTRRRKRTKTRKK